MLLRKLCFLFLMTLLLCPGTASARPPGDQDRIRDVETPVNRILYHRWTGTSPGAGFTATRLNACELDLKRARIRRLSRTARAPQAMLPHEQDQVLKLLKAMPWTSLSCHQIDEYRDTVSAWLKTKPPDVYNIPKGLGREDGYVETLTVFAAETQRTTRVNPRPPFVPNDPKRPPAKWHSLVSALTEDPWVGVYDIYTRGVGIGVFQPFEDVATITISKDGDLYRLDYGSSRKAPIRFRVLNRNRLENADKSSAPYIQALLVSRKRVLHVCFSFHTLYLVNGSTPKDWKVVPLLKTHDQDGRKFTVVKAIPGLRLHPDTLGDPTKKDRAEAKKIDSKIDSTALAYLKKHGYGKYSLSAARRVGNYILLCYVSEEIDDGDKHLVYSVERAEIVGGFSWYYQG